MSDTIQRAEPYTFTVFGLDGKGRVLLGSGVGLRQGRHVADAAIAEGRAVGAWVMEDVPNHHVAYRAGDVPAEV